MNALTGEEIAQCLDGIVYEKKQRHAHAFDLTVDAISRFEGPGRLDFGGSEFEAAASKEIQVEKRSPDDDYGWWSLSEGRYRVRFNERITTDDEVSAWILPHERLLHAGGDHSSVPVTGSDRTLAALLSVGEHGLYIKENARISTLIVHVA